MSDHEDEGWSDEEARALRHLGDAAAPPAPELTLRVTRTLRSLGLIARARSEARAFVPWGLAAVFAVAGFAVGRASAPPPLPLSPPGQRYVLLLNGAGSASAQENESRRKEYGDWLHGLQGRGLGVSGEELVGESHDLPGPRNGEPVVGYFVISAHDEAEAISIARTTPHLLHGGGVTVAALR